MNVEINLWGVLLAAIASMGVGAVWYSKMAFGEVWSRLVKLSDKQMQEGSTQAMGIAFLMALLTAYILAHVTYISANFFDVSYMESAINTAFFLWLGISLTSMVTHGLFEQKRKKLIALTATHELVSLLVMGLVLGWLAL